MATPTRIYIASTPGIGSALRQCEILTNVKQVRALLETVGADDLTAFAVTHAFALVTKQDCELEQDFAARRAAEAETDPAKREALLLNDKIIPDVTLCPIVTAGQLRGAGKMTKDIWARIRQNVDIRYQFLQAVEAGDDAVGEGLPELAIDFKREFSIPTDELYKRIGMGEARRRCRLDGLYLAHLSSRLGSYQHRIGLPADHFSEPAAG